MTDENVAYITYGSYSVFMDVMVALFVLSLQSSLHPHICYSLIMGRVHFSIP